MAADQANVAPDVAPVRVPSWGVVAACVAVAVWVAVMSLTVVAVSWPRRVAPRRVAVRRLVRRRPRHAKPDRPGLFARLTGGHRIIRDEQDGDQADG